ncbi:MAG: diguanylate cyclase domain-containing protein [Gemmatirosa sp.]
MPRPSQHWRGWRGAMLGLGVSACLVGVAGAIAWRDRARTQVADAWVQHTRDMLALAASAASAVDRAESAERGYLLLGDSAALRAGAHADLAVTEAVAALRRRTVDNASQQRRLDTLARVLPRWLAERARIVASAQAGDGARAIAAVRASARHDDVRTIRTLLARAASEEKQLLEARLTARQARAHAALLQTLLTLAVAVATTAWAIVLLGRALRRQAERRESLRAALATSEASEVRYRGLFTALPRPAWVYDVETLRFLAVNPAATAQYGWSEAEFLERRITDVRPRGDAARVAESARTVGNASVTAAQWRHRWRDGRERDVLVTTHPLEYAGRAARLAIVDDVTEQLASDRALRSRDARFRAAMTGMRDAFLVLRAVRTDGDVRDFDILEMNAAGARLLGASAVDVERRTLLALFPHAAAAGFLAIGRRVLADGQSFEGEQQTRGARAPAAEWVRLQVFPLEGEPDTLVVIVRDITARKRAEARLRAEAQRDALTGLLNRRGLEDAVERRLQEAAAAGHPDVLLYLDLDGLKPINDTFGHAEGDEALRAVAALLRRAVRAGDAIARLGGDEFVVYAPAGPHGAERDVELLTQRVQHALGAERARNDAAGRRYDLRASVGGTTVRSGDTLASVLARADAALYQEKSRRRGTRRAS